MTKTNPILEGYRMHAEHAARLGGEQTKVPVGAADLLMLLDDAAEVRMVREHLVKKVALATIEPFARLLMAAEVDHVELTAGWNRHVLRGGQPLRTVRLVRPEHAPAEVWANMLEDALGKLMAADLAATPPKG